MNTEEWRSIIGFDAYEISNMGRVRSIDRVDAAGDLRRGRILSPHPNRLGYIKIRLRKDLKRHTSVIHRLVLEAFVGPCPPGMQGCHNNGIRSDNRLQNLRWGTLRENQQDRRKHGTYFNRENHPLAKLRTADIEMIMSLRDAGIPRKEIAKKFSVSMSALYAAIRHGRAHGSKKA